MVEKKVIAVIVEGPSDESAIGGILKEYFCSSTVAFMVVHGDITSDDRYSPDSIVSGINSFVEEYGKKYGYEWGDYIRLIHIADTDGVFTKGCVIKDEVESIQYSEESIRTSDVRVTERRNEHKSEIMFKLSSTGKIKGVRYRLYYNSCNLEHVLYNELRDFTDDEKESLSDEFAERYEGKADEFVEFISGSDLAVSGTYKETWKFIMKDKNSLHRHTNMQLMFED